MTAKPMLAIALCFTALSIAIPASAQENSAQDNAAATTSDEATTAATQATAPAAPVGMTDEQMDAVHALAKAGDPEKGEQKAAACAACHAADGNSTIAMYPKIAGQGERYIAKQLAMFKTKERDNAVMYPFAMSLSPQDMRDIGAYFSRQKASSGLADESPVSGGDYDGVPFYQVGQSLYRAGDASRNSPACTACHGPSGEGNPGAKYPALAGQYASYTEARLKAYRDGAVYGKGDRGNGIMADVAKNLTDTEIQALATYIEGLHAAELPKRPLPEGSKQDH